MIRPHTGRRRSRYAAQLCAASAALLILLSLSILHTRISSSPLRLRLPPPHNPSLLPDHSIHISHTDSFDAIDQIDDQNDPESDDPELPGHFWDHAAGVARLSFGKQEQHRFYASPEKNPRDKIRIAFGSDDQPVDEDVRYRLNSIKHIEDALMLGNSPLREGWAGWLEGKANFLRRDRMLRSNLELLNPENHRLLQDPDMPGVTSLTRGDRLMQRAILKESEEKSPIGEEVKRVELRRSLHLEEEKKKNVSRGVHVHDDGRRWGYFPGIDPHLSFSEFMDRFLGGRLCRLRVFMVWNSPPWMFGVRHQRGLESLLYHHKDACVVVFSETMELDFFKDFVKDGFKVAVAMPNLDELLKDTPTHVFASVWYEWRKTKHYPVHYSELLRLAALYKYGGVYLDSDIIVLHTLYSLENAIGIENQNSENSILNGAVMSFRKHSPFLLECLREFYATYDDARLRWNGAALLTRVFERLQGEGGASNRQLDIKIGSTIAFFPISHSNITRYFVAAVDEMERSEQDVLFKRILNESVTFHFWNGLTSALIPEPNSLVERVLNQYCLHCLDGL